MILTMGDQTGWRCPLCGATAASGVEHLRSEHGMGGPREDRFGLREAVRPTREAGGVGTARPRPPRPTRRLRLGDEEVRPARPTPLPPEAAVLRLVCESLDGLDSARLQARLAELPGVESAAVDLYEGTADLFLDRRRAVPPHLVALATERVGLTVKAAELHRAPAAGAKLGPDTVLLVLQ